MNLAATVVLYAGGPGSGCQGENCGRPKLQLWIASPSSGEKGLFQGAEKFEIGDQHGVVVGRMFVEPPVEGHLNIRYIAGEGRAPFGTAELRGLLQELARYYPEATSVGGLRITGVHYRVWEKMKGEDPYVTMKLRRTA